MTNLPVLGLTLKHHGILRLADLAIVLLLDLLGALLGLDTVILGEGALVAGTTGVGEEVRADGLDGALRRGADLADGLEVLLGGPALGEDWERTGDNGGGRHLFFFLLSMEMGRQKCLKKRRWLMLRWWVPVVEKGRLGLGHGNFFLPCNRPPPMIHVPLSHTSLAHGPLPHPPASLPQYYVLLALPKLHPTASCNFAVFPVKHTQLNHTPDFSHNYIEYLLLKLSFFYVNMFVWL